MENIGTYFFITIALVFGIYAYLKKKKITHPTGDKERVFNPKAPSKPKTKKPNQKKNNSPKETKKVESQVSSPTIVASQNNLENEAKLLQARTGWDYDTAKAYCLQAAEYHQKITLPVRLKKN